MYESIIPLNRVPEGAIARVTGLFTTGAMRRRLQDIGLIEGTDIECLQKSPAGRSDRLLHQGRGDRAAFSGFRKHIGTL